MRAGFKMATLLAVAMMVAVAAPARAKTKAKAAGEVRVLKDADDFEATVIQDRRAWLVAFLYKDDAFMPFARKIAAVEELGVRVAVIDFNAKTREVCYENNVRKRSGKYKCPQLRLFPTRSRTSVHIAVPDTAAVARSLVLGTNPAADVARDVAAALAAAGCERDEEGRAVKVTLALGGAPGAGVTDEL